MGILSWIIFGALAGWIANKLMNHDHHMGLLKKIIVGIIGAALGGWLSSLIFGLDGITGFNFSSMLIAIGGSCLLLWIFGRADRR